MKIREKRVRICKWEKKEYANERENMQMREKERICKLDWDKEYANERDIICKWER